MGKIIGIDLGSYNSCVSVLELGKPKTIPNSEGGTTTPSYVFIDGGEIKVGDSARRQAALKPENTIFNIKRLMGKSYDQVKHLKRPYKIVDNKGRAAVQIGERVYTPEEISAMILQKMKKTAEDFLGEPVTRAVITVPAHFNTEEREATKLAGEIAGFTVERLIAEPTAAILNINDSASSGSKKYAVFDFGGQTFDMSLVDVGDNVFEILATDGDLELGGSGIDEKIVNWLADEFQTENGIDIRKDPLALQRLFEAGEKAKIELSGSSETEINLPFLFPVDGIAKHLVRKLSRSKFNQLADEFISKTIEISKKALKESGLNISDITDVILVGGSTRIPAIQDELEKLFGKKPNKSLNADTCVSTGATIQGGVITGEVKDLLLLDVIPISLGIETQGGVFTKMIEANKTIPCDSKEVFSTAVDNQPSVSINVFQGERQFAKDNKSLGQFDVDGIPPAPRGIPQIEVKFSVDVNGILTVSAQDKGTGKQNSVKIQNSSLSEEEIARMKSDAEANADADSKAKEVIEKVNSAENMIYSIEKMIKDAPNMPDAGRTELETIVHDLKQAVSSKDLAQIDTLSALLQEKSGEVYQQMTAQAQQNESAQPSEQPGDVNENKTESSAESIEFEEVGTETSDKK